MRRQAEAATPGLAAPQPQVGPVVAGQAHHGAVYGRELPSEEEADRQAEAAAVAASQQEKDEEFIQMLADYSAEKPSTSRILLLAETLKERYGDKEASDFIAEYMKANPSVRGLNRSIDMSLAGSAEGETREHLGVLKQLSEQLLNDKSLYKCRRCGFETPLMQWRCRPDSCR